MIPVIWCAIPASQTRSDRKIPFGIHPLTTPHESILPDSATNIPRTLFLHAGLPGCRNRPRHGPGTIPPKLPVIPQKSMLLCQRAPRDAKNRSPNKHRVNDETHCLPAKSRLNKTAGTGRALVCLAPQDPEDLLRWRRSAHQSGPAPKDAGQGKKNKE
jgi:hypothetical protein